MVLILDLRCDLGTRFQDSKEEIKVGPTADAVRGEDIDDDGLTGGRKQLRLNSIYGSLDQQTQAMNFDVNWDHDSSSSSSSEEEEEDEDDDNGSSDDEVGAQL